MDETLCNCKLKKKVVKNNMGNILKLTPSSAKNVGFAKKIIVRDPNPTPWKKCGSSLEVDS